MKDYDILLFTDFEEGHIFLLYKLASDLQKWGFSVCFVGIEDSMKMVELKGFNTHVILNGVFPSGWVKEMKTKKIKVNSIPLMSYIKDFVSETEKVVNDYKPKLVFFNTHQAIEALLMHYKYRVKQIMLHTSLPDLDNDPNFSLGQLAYYKFIKKALNFDSELYQLFIPNLKEKEVFKSSYEELALPIQEMPQVMLCPKELDIIKRKSDKNNIYIGPCMNLNLNNTGWLEANNLNHKKIIYACVGSQSKEYPERALKFFNTILESMESDELKDLHLILSVSSNIEDWDLRTIPSNVSVFNWVPQTEVLQKATLAINHAGLGSVKECIHFGVPMIVIPMGRDHADIAKRIEYHKMGTALQVEEISPQIMVDKISNLQKNVLVRSNLLKMKFVFQKESKNEKLLYLIKNVLKKNV